MIQDGIERDQKTNTITISSSSAKLLRLAGTKYLITTYNLSGQKPSTSVDKFNLYLNDRFEPHAYLTTDFTVAKNLIDLISKLTDPLSQAVVLEQNTPTVVPDPSPAGKANVILNEDLNVSIEVDAKRDSLLILTDSYYPGWQATIDGIKKPIYPANLNERMVIVPEGKHLIKFGYKPYSFLSEYTSLK